ncbi:MULTISPECIES: YajQ family cyclic di-GMP-binding protein [unclassified Marinobacterium]|jgi:uncharacterized protein YajQ (UPF0234 family)|uniref:YajQ family cyclic di-GMP-binding protein n=1 Tax=unclassified Marinobacterium TaxID=2644139 RepID=UPI0015693DA9|nr:MULTISPECIES: YajQ family cyclic di-GMP-binding protein [unclassified Marinobacterium]NRP09493.1 putative nucleotide-binding protein [Marinobacterium sp. xm-g-48]NRP15968.1 putative nucleotide-binding protein [Marinobacterium sp. xm-a-152]NRP26833.1 putative nucleotide-binding protein [Marinobacterium sp. xm-d-420]NRP46281.1 putative nucleotide-binding protein [Marinobacterium sp. xm-d-543]NRP52741.1 putative nucleotide-binding protein [Marinobacterium sp. xm-v-242]
MPSFDIVSEVDSHEVANAVDQANREISTRFDFKGVDASFELDGESVKAVAEADFQLKQMIDVLRAKLVNRKIDPNCMDIQKAEQNGKQARQTIVLKQGLDQAANKKLGKLIKDSKLKVQTQVQGEQLRVTGKKRDDLQAVMALLRESDFELPLQYKNFRD